MNCINPDREAIIVDRLIEAPAAVRLNLKLERSLDGGLHVMLPFASENVTEGNMVHGGVIATLIDVAAVAGAVASAPAPPSNGATANLAITFLAPAKGCDLIAVPRSLRAGKRQHVVGVAVTDSDGRAVAEGLATVMLG